MVQRRGVAAEDTETQQIKGRAVADKHLDGDVLAVIVEAPGRATGGSRRELHVTDPFHERQGAKLIHPVVGIFLGTHDRNHAFPFVASILIRHVPKLQKHREDDTERSNRYRTFETNENSSQAFVQGNLIGHQ